MNGLIRPNGSNIFADTFKSDRLVTGSLCAYSINSEKQKRNSSVWLFHVIPSNSGTSDSVQDLPNPNNLLSSEAFGADLSTVTDTLSGLTL